MAFDPTNNKYFFNEYLNNNGQLVVRKMEWVPNGTAVQQTDWGQDNGQTSWDTSLTPGWAYMGGAVSDGADLLMFANGDLKKANMVHCCFTAIAYFLLPHFRSKKYSTQRVQAILLLEALLATWQAAAIFHSAT